MANRVRLVAESETPTVWQPPPVVGLAPVFADRGVERRYRAAGQEQNRRLLFAILLFATLVSGATTAATFLAWPGERPPALYFWPSLAEMGVPLLCGLALSQIRSARGIEILALVFGLLYASARCLLLALRPDESSAAVLIGSVALLYFGLPVRLWLLAPLMATASGAMVAAWSVHVPPPGAAAIVELSLWVWLSNLVGLTALRTARLALRTAWAQTQSLQHITAHDVLTGSANRRCFDQALSREWAVCQRTSQPVSLILIDIDHFQALNDTVGYATGDACLRALAEAMESCLRGPGELLARTDGNEFACLLPNTGEPGARGAADRLMAAIRGAAVAHPSTAYGPIVTATLGVATVHKVKSHSAWELAALANRLMRAGKSDGGNRIRQQTLGVAPPPPVAVRAEPVAERVRKMESAPGD